MNILFCERCGEETLALDKHGVCGACNMEHEIDCDVCGMVLAICRCGDASFHGAACCKNPSCGRAFWEGD